MVTRFFAGCVALSLVASAGLLAGQEDPDYTFILEEGTGPAGGEATVRVVFDNPNATENLQGWSYGICNDPAVVIPLSEEQGDVVMTVNNGNDPDFYAPAFFDNGMTLGVVVCLLGCAVLEPVSMAHFQTVTYAIDAGAATGSETPVELCNELGDPIPTDVLLVTQDQEQIVPTQINSVITIGDLPTFGLSVGSGSGCQGDGASIPVTMDNPAAEVEGFSFGLAHDSTVLSLLSIDEGAITAATNGGDGPDFFVTNTDAANGPGGTVGCIVSATAADTIPAGVGAEVAIMNYQVTIGAASGSTTDLSFVDDLGSPPVANLIAVKGLPQVPSLSDGAFTADPDMTCMPPVGTPFRRGDVNDDSFVDVSDGVFLANWLFDLGTTVTCDDAADTDDNGALDINDIMHLLNALFLPGSPSIPAPNPPLCGVDPTDDTLECDIYGSC